MSKILITTSSFHVQASASLQELNSKNIECVVNPYARRITEDEATKLIQEIQPIGMIAGVEKLGRTQMEACSQLKVISRCGTGLDNVDLEAAKSLGISVFNTPDAPTPSVAELALGLILNCMRQISHADRLIRENTWQAQKGGLLSGKTLGIIGFGRIGQRLAKLLNGFDVKLLVHDPYVNPSLFPSLSFMDLDTALKNSDVVSLHLSHSQDTHHLINQQRLKSMKKGAVLINVARGGLIDEDALYEALASEHLFAAGLDVFEEEPYSGRLKNLPQVVLTSHMGSAAKETRNIMEEEAAANLLKGLKAIGAVA